jgi:hypothetical protein
LWFIIIISIISIFIIIVIIIIIIIRSCCGFIIISFCCGFIIIFIVIVIVIFIFCCGSMCRAKLQQHDCGSGRQESFNRALSRGRGRDGAPVRQVQSQVQYAMRRLTLELWYLGYSLV